MKDKVTPQPVCIYCNEVVSHLYKLIAVDRPVYMNLCVHKECYEKVTDEVIVAYIKGILR